jgi:hypothetical protein
MHLFCAVVLNWFRRSIVRNQSGAPSVLWTGYVQHLGNVFYLKLMRISISCSDDDGCYPMSLAGSVTAFLLYRNINDGNRCC